MDKPKGAGPDVLWQMGPTFGSSAFWNASVANPVSETDFAQLMFQPMKAVVLGQLALFSLVNRRAQARLELPNRLAACRTAEDLMREQMLFFQVALQDYSKANRKIADAWGVAMKADRVSETEVEPNASVQKHDYLGLSVPDTGHEDPGRDDGARAPSHHTGTKAA